MARTKKSSRKAIGGKAARKSLVSSKKDKTKKEVLLPPCSPPAEKSDAALVVTPEDLAMLRAEAEERLGKPAPESWEPSPLSDDDMPGGYVSDDYVPWEIPRLVPREAVPLSDDEDGEVLDMRLVQE